jgi:hypothetical protein
MEKNNDHADKCYDNHYKLVNSDDLDDLSSLLKFFKVKIPLIDDMIEKMLYDLMITDDLNKNEKKIVTMFINNLKNTNFAELKLLYMIIFISAIKKLIDSIEGESFKKQVLLKGFFFIFSFFVTNSLITAFKKFENYNIDEVLANILNMYNKHLSFRLLNNIENNNDDDTNFKSDYQSNIELVLKLNKLFIVVIYHYLRLINIYGYIIFSTHFIR